MAESPKADVREAGESIQSDHDFDVTAEMMVHDLDDEATMEEEELLADREEDFTDELEDLQKEGDMPLETLLAMYGYSDENQPDTNIDVPLDEIKPEPLPPLDGTEDEEIEPPLPLSMEDRLPLLHSHGDHITFTPSSLDENSLSPPSQDSAPSFPASHRNNNYFPENQRITRGLAAAYNHFNLGESSSSDDDEDYVPEDWKKEIQIGPEHQAQVPDMVGPSYEDVVYEGDDKCLWNPQKICETELQHYYKCVCCKPGMQEMKSRDDEQALYLLFQCEYNVDAAVKKRTAQTSPQAEVALWSEDECRDFESGLRIYGKDFRQIQQNRVTGRDVGEIVQFYYLWKKTERHDAFACQSRLAKKKYAFHPGITDYMDRFLDENESAASSRASSPHHFAGRARPTLSNGIGIMSTQGTVQSLITVHQTVAAPTTEQHVTTVHHRVAAPSEIPHMTTTQQTVAAPTTLPHSTTVHQTVAAPTAMQYSTVLMSHDTVTSIPTPSSAAQGQIPNNQEVTPSQQYVPTSVIVASLDKGEPPVKKPRIESTHRPKLINSKPPPLKPIMMGATAPFPMSNLLKVGLNRPVPLSSSSSSHEHLYGSNHLPNLANPESSLYMHNN